MEPPEVPMETDFTAVFQAFHQSNSTVADLVIALAVEEALGSVLMLDIFCFHFFFTFFK